jgi:rubrerythrin
VLSPRAIFGEIFDNDEAFQLFCSIAASGEAQGGWENGRIAQLVPSSYRELAPKIARHGADEDKHGRIFRGLLRKRGLPPVDVPSETDYTMLLERRGIGLPHDKLRSDEGLTEQDIIAYLVHSRVTEQRASKQMRALRKHVGEREDIRRAIRQISNDEDNHLAYCHEELLRLESAGFADTIRRMLRATALAEIRVYRDVSLAVMAHTGRILHWSKAKSAVLAAGIEAVYVYERAGGWRRMVSLRMPARRNALGGQMPSKRSATASAETTPKSARSS